MKVQFNYNAGKIWLILRGVLQNARESRARVLANLIGTAIFSGLVFFVCLLSDVARGPGRGHCGGGLGALYYAGTYQGRFEARMRRFFREKLGDENDFGV